MKHRLVNFACWLSLALCLASITGWVWSHVSYEEEAWSGRGERSDGVRTGWWLQVSLRNGRLGITRVWAVDPGDGKIPNPPYYGPLYSDLWQAYRRARDPSSKIERYFGFSAGRASQRDWSYGCLIVPFWCITLITAVLPVWRGRALWRARRSRKRVAAGLCGACGYDLRGGVSDRCPECGSATAAA